MRLPCKGVCILCRARASAHAAIDGSVGAAAVVTVARHGKRHLLARSCLGCPAAVQLATSSLGERRLYLIRSIHRVGVLGIDHTRTVLDDCGMIDSFSTRLKQRDFNKDSFAA